MGCWPGLGEWISNFRTAPKLEDFRTWGSLGTGPSSPLHKKGKPWHVYRWDVEGETSWGVSDWT